MGRQAGSFGTVLSTGQYRLEAFHLTFVTLGVGGYYTYLPGGNHNLNYNVESVFPTQMPLSCKIYLFLAN